MLGIDRNPTLVRGAPCLPNDLFGGCQNLVAVDLANRHGVASALSLQKKLAQPFYTDRILLYLELDRYCSHSPPCLTHLMLFLSFLSCSGRYETSSKVSQTFQMSLLCQRRYRRMQNGHENHVGIVALSFVCRRVPNAH